MIRKSIAGIVFFLLLFQFSPSVGEAATAPTVQMRRTVEGILAVLRESESQRPQVEKENAILALVEARFDFQEMSKRTLGANWKRLSADQQRQFVGRFSQLLEKTYVRKIKRYSGQNVRFGDELIRRNKAVVESFVVKDRIETPLVYRLRIVGQQWLVYDVVIEGVSLVSNYRSQFRSLLDRQKFTGLMLRLEEKLARLAEDG